MTFKLESMISRIAVVVAMGLICGFLFYIAFGHFIVRSIADRRYILGREAIVAAAEKRPDSARINYRLAESEMTEPSDPIRALYHATRAVDLSPWDYKARRLLASAQELNGQQAEAESSTLAAVKLAPHHAELNWTIANLYVRNGKLEPSLAHFRIASLTRPDLLDASFDLLWQASGEDIETLKSMAGTEPDLQLALVKYMVDKGRSQDAINVFSAVDRKTRLDSPRSGEFINSLIAAGQFGPARTLWVDLASAMIKIDSSVAGSIWNGGFESDWLQDFGQFDWMINPDKYARIGFDKSERHTGQRSIRLLFAGLDTTLLRDQIRQLVVLKPGVRYRLDCYAKATDLVTPEAPRLAILGGTEVIAASSPMEAGSTEWKQLSVEFVAPESAAPKYVSIIRIPKFSYDEVTRGTIWFDDFRLTQLGSDGSN